MELVTYNIFRELSKKISAQEYQSLELDILQYGCKDPIIAWGDVIVDGHKRYAICKKYDIPFRIDQKHFGTYSEAQRWARRQAKRATRQLEEIMEDTVESPVAEEASPPMLKMPPKPVVPKNATLDINCLTAKDINRFLLFLRERFGTDYLKELVFMLMVQIVHNQDKDATRHLLQQLYNLYYTPSFTERGHGVPCF